MDCTTHRGRFVDCRKHRGRSLDCRTHKVCSTAHTGPSLQSSIIHNIVRWRTYRFAYHADIEKMYRQILIHPKDRKFQKILWRFNHNDPFNIYELNTVTYGLAPHAFQAIRVLLQLAIDESDKFHKASKLISENMYVDDALFGADSIPEAIELSREFLDLF